MPELYSRIEIKVPDSSGLVQQIDRACQQRDMSRSEWLREAAREKLSRDGDMLSGQETIQLPDLLDMLTGEDQWLTTATT